MTKKRVGIKVELGVERDDFAVAGQDQRIDFGKRRVGFVERAIQALEHRARLRHAAVGNADLARNVVGLLGGESLRWIDEDLVDSFRRFGGDFLDIHAPLGACHQHHALRSAVDDHADIEFLLDVRAFLDKQSAHLLSLRARLMRDQLHAEDFAGEIAYLSDRLRDLDPATLAAPACMDLRLDHPDLAAECLRGLRRLIDGKRRNAARRRHTELAQYFFALVLVDLHGCSLGRLTPFA